MLGMVHSEVIWVTCVEVLLVYSVLSQAWLSTDSVLIAMSEVSQNAFWQCRSRSEAHARSSRVTEPTESCKASCVPMSNQEQRSPRVADTASFDEPARQVGFPALHLMAPIISHHSSTLKYSPTTH